MEPIKTRLLIRFEIIELWNKGNEEILNSYCCPICRSVLLDYDANYAKSDIFLYCHNEGCMNYDLPIERIE